MENNYMSEEEKIFVNKSSMASKNEAKEEKKSTNKKEIKKTSFKEQSKSSKISSHISEESHSFLHSSQEISRRVTVKKEIRKETVTHFKSSENKKESHSMISESTNINNKSNQNKTMNNEESINISKQKDLKENTSKFPQKNSTDPNPSDNIISEVHPMNIIEKKIDSEVDQLKNAGISESIVYTTENNDSNFNDSEVKKGGSFEYGNQVDDQKDQNFNINIQENLENLEKDINNLLSNEKINELIIPTSSNQNILGKADDQIDDNILELEKQNLEDKKNNMNITTNSKENSISQIMSKFKKNKYILGLSNESFDTFDKIQKVKDVLIKKIEDKIEYLSSLLSKIGNEEQKLFSNPPSLKFSATYIDSIKSLYLLNLRDEDYSDSWKLFITLIYTVIKPNLVNENANFIESYDNIVATSLKEYNKLPHLLISTEEKDYIINIKSIVKLRNMILTNENLLHDLLCSTVPSQIKQQPYSPLSIIFEEIMIFCGIKDSSQMNFWKHELIRKDFRSLTKLTHLLKSS